ncbi:hypothetical protein HBH43_004920 [Parastagonospora nodorum]|nr:hypothetical protein HBH43_004920 [Parastagonospora nodorum]KAH5794117.1 hypothetical protein HBI97_027820 [Parastagonospora nodorum]KAH5971623.1 hypothetical protein HBI85_056670 [Parastagonospora nodorum]KAH6461253.1 hypothetical protein HBI59_064110 [Parastagonospora nodorum]
MSGIEFYQGGNSVGRALYVSRLCLLRRRDRPREFLILFDLTFLATGSHGTVFFFGWLWDRRLRLAIVARRVASALQSQHFILQEINVMYVPCCRACLRFHHSPGGA